MYTANVMLSIHGQAVSPYVGEWQLISSVRYPDAEYDWSDAQLFEAEAKKSGDPLSLEEALVIEQMIREKVAEEGGGALETLPTGYSQMTYKVYHAAHGSPFPWAIIVAFIAANWKGILIALGILAATAALITFTIKASSIIWKAGGKIEDLIEGLPPVAVGLGVGIIVLLLLLAMGQRKGKA
ncbi:hypothetical protein ES703_28687 [subsurface metagenome]